MEELLSQKGHRIVIKWFQPYMILQAAKKYFDIHDYTFNGLNKFECMDDFLNEINSAQKITIGLYMKNVNKFYVLVLKDGINQENDISALYNLLLNNQFDSDEHYDNDDWCQVIQDTDKAFNMIDLGRAEASFIMKLG